MVSLEQIKLLESKVSRTIDYVKKVTEENTLLKGKLDSYQKRIEELEVLIQRFREEQSRIEDGILAALDSLNQFEDALESKLSAESIKPAGSGGSAESKASVENPPEKKPSAGSGGSGPIVVPEPPMPEPPMKEEKTSDTGAELDIF